MFQAALTRQEMPHAILIECNDPLAAEAAGLALTRQLLAGDPLDRHCHAPQSSIFRQVASGAHPDFDRLAPDESKSSRRNAPIPVDQVRQAIERFHMAPATAPGKVMLIAPAEALNLNAANALLKILEEPPLGSVIILLCTNRQTLLATIRSRCVTVRLPGDGAAAADFDPELYAICLRALTLEPGSAPGKLAAANELQAALKQHGPDAVFAMFERVMIRAVENAYEMTVEPDFAEEFERLRRLVTTVGLERLLQLWDKLQARKRQVDGLYLDPWPVYLGLIEACAPAPAPVR